MIYVCYYKPDKLKQLIHCISNCLLHQDKTYDISSKGAAMKAKTQGLLIKFGSEIGNSSRVSLQYGLAQCL